MSREHSAAALVLESGRAASSRAVWIGVGKFGLETRGPTYRGAARLGQPTQIVPAVVQGRELFRVCRGWQFREQLKAQARPWFGSWLAL